MCPPFDFGNRTIVKDGEVLMQGTVSSPKLPTISVPVSRTQSINVDKFINLDDTVVIALLSGAIRNHNLGCEFTSANVYWYLLAKLQDPVRNYRIYTCQVCTHCASIHHHKSCHLLTSRCENCAYVIHSYQEVAQILASESNLIDCLNFQIAKLSQPYHDLLMEYLHHAENSTASQC